MLVSYSDFIAQSNQLRRKLINCVPTLSSRTCFTMFRIYLGDGRRRFDDYIDKIFNRLPLNRTFEYLSLVAMFHDISRLILPEYYSITGELMVDDWLASIDFRKFNRDHIVHQYLTTYIIDKLTNDKSWLMSKEISLKSCLATQIIHDDLECSSYLKHRLNQLLQDNEYSLDISSSSCFFLWQKIIQNASLIAGMYHDIGYPFQYTNRTKKPLNPIVAHEDVDYKIKRELFERHYHRMFMIPFRNYHVYPIRKSEREFELFSRAYDYSHGLYSAMSLLDMHDRYSSAYGHDPLFTFSLEWAALAIMMHDMRSVYWDTSAEPEIFAPEMRIDFCRDPLSAIVTLADYLQEFDRYYADFTQQKKDVIVKYNKNCSKASISLDRTGELNIKFKMDSDEALSRKRRDLINDYDLIFHARNGYLDLSGLGVRSVKLSAER